MGHLRNTHVLNEWMNEWIWIYSDGIMMESTWTVSWYLNLDLDVWQFLCKRGGISSYWVSCNYNVFLFGFGISWQILERRLCRERNLRFGPKSAPEVLVFETKTWGMRISPQSWSPRTWTIDSWSKYVNCQTWSLESCRGRLGGLQNTDLGVQVWVEVNHWYVRSP